MPGSPSAIAESSVARFPPVKINSQLVFAQGPNTAADSNRPPVNSPNLPQAFCRTAPTANHTIGVNRNNTVVCLTNIDKPREIPKAIAQKKEEGERGRVGEGENLYFFFVR